ncbi:low temperature requirement protein A [Streptomyces sp. 3MP-14]|uniref:Low temperature requirement protein A n=1 Tax=Streptomyces mimosae TaxID=2586635 RepID=A0A5N6A1G9_9ACTN|nr:MULTISPECIES: low temperature requirement protein A [Streptomyces]KAB8162521.1 low temperature requirement protein A [Streptomyces mimosae]KAB8174348.1 low temperature requirement protein A [Streptomyces sp. 3MP-14]
MTARDTNEPHRTATPLELFFDLCFVVAVAQIAGELHEYLAQGRPATAVGSFLTVFFAIWWGWMGFTWFSSAFDPNDVPFRLVTLVIVTGALVLAAGVRPAFEEHDFALVVVGYTVMRLALISLWLRAACAGAAGRRTGRTFAAGLAVVQGLWCAWLLLPEEWQRPVFVLLALLDLAVPVLGERVRPTSWHAHHIAERYGLFTMIVLGESVMSATSAVRRAVDADYAGGDLYLLAGGGLLTVFAMWWMYFASSAGEFLDSTREGFLWGYGHYLIFGAAAAVGAGLALNIDALTDEAALTDAGAAATVTVPVAVYLMAVWALHVRPHHRGGWGPFLFPAGATLVLAATVTAMPVVATGLVTAGLVAVGVLRERAAERRAERARAERARAERSGGAAA